MPEGTCSPAARLASGSPFAPDEEASKFEKLVGLIDRASSGHYPIQKFRSDHAPHTEFLQRPSQVHIVLPASPIDEASKFRLGQMRRAKVFEPLLLRFPIVHVDSPRVVLGAHFFVDERSWHDRAATMAPPSAAPAHSETARLRYLDSTC